MTRVLDKRKFALVVKNTYGNLTVYVDNGEKEAILPTSEYVSDETTDIFWIPEGTVIKAVTIGGSFSFSLYKNGVAVDLTNPTSANGLNWFGGFTAGDCVLMKFEG